MINNCQAITSWESHTNMKNKSNYAGPDCVVWKYDEKWKPRHTKPQPNFKRQYKNIILRVFLQR